MWPPSPSKLRRRGGFTLVEMITVIGIIAILFTVISLSLSTASDGQKLRLAINDIRSTLRYARTYAVANNTEVSVFFAHDPAKAKPSTAPAMTPSALAAVYPTPRSKQYFARSYCVYSHRDRALISQWKPLPPGVVFDCETTPSSGSFTYNVLQGDKTLVSLPQFVVTDVMTTARIAVPAVTFRADGGLKLNNGQIGTYQVMVTAGSTDGDNPTVSTPTILYKNASSNRSFAGLSILALTGETEFFEVSP